MKQTLVLLIALVLALTQGMTAQEIVTNGFIADEATRLKGDVNGDGQVSIADVTELIDYILGSPSEDFIVENADVDGDGNVAIADITDLIDTILGVPSIQPEINVNTDVINFGNVPVGQSETMTFIVTGTNLTGALMLSSTSSRFTVDPRTIIPDENGAVNQVVTVTYTPNNAASNAGYIKISGGGIQPDTIRLSGRGVVPTITVNPDTIIFDGSTSPKTFTVTGYDLTGNLTVSSTTSQFTVSPRTITPDANGTVYKTVTVTWTPTSVGNHAGYITVSGGGAESKRVVVIYHQQVQPPEITTVPADTLEFGSVLVGQSKTLPLRITGQGLTGDLTVSSTTARFSVTPTTITPDENGAVNKIVTVTYTPTQAGVNGAWIKISGGGAETKKVYVHGKGVVPYLTVDPKSINYGTVLLGDSASRTVTITATNLTGDLTLKTTNNTRFKVNHKTSITLTPDANGAINETVTVTYKPTQAQSNGGYLLISGGGIQQDTVTLSGTCVASTLTVTPMSLDFGTVALGTSKSQSFTVMGTDLTENVTLTCSGSPYFSCSPTTITKSNATGGAIVTVTYQPTTVGTHTATITITSGSLSKTVSITGTCVAPTITVSPTSLSFGSIPIGSSKQMRFTVAGTGLTGNLNLSSSSSTVYSVSPSTITPDANGTVNKQVTVTFSPILVKTYTGTVTVSGGGAEAKTVSLTGKGIEETVY